MDAGIRWGALGSDMVSIFEEHTARIEKGYRLKEWASMDMTERALIIALRRVDIAIKNHQTEAEVEKAQREAKKSGKGRR